MKISDNRIDQGTPFDWGLISKDYGLYRDIYPDLFYQKIIERHLCVEGQDVLDLGTGTGVLPRHLYDYGATWTGVDLSQEQIIQAKEMAGDKRISFIVSATEDLSFPDASFDVVTACQCFWYFDHQRVIPLIHRLLKDDGILLILQMMWLPYEDEIAKASEDLVLKFSPQWGGAGETRHPIELPDICFDYFDVIDHEEYDVKVPFTKASWHGRMKACRGVGASLNEEALACWEKAHMDLLDEIAPESFEILHYCALTVLKKKS